MKSPSESLDALLGLIAEQVSGTIYPPGRRTQISLAYFNITLDHHSAIARLLDVKLYASAFALARPMYEALVKGLWLGHFATEEEAERHALGKEIEQITPLIDQLLGGNLPPVVAHQLRNIKQNYWKALSSLTHAGHTQVRCWLTPTGVAPSYEPAAIHELSNFACFMALSAGVEMARLGDNASAVANLSAMLPEHEPNDD